MPKHARRRHGAVLDFFYVRRANAARGHFNQQFIRTDARHRQSFQAKIVRTAINNGTHGSRNNKHEKVLTTNDCG
jgi:hypothetical protein